jgi:antitoxin HicB
MVRLNNSRDQLSTQLKSYQNEDLHYKVLLRKEEDGTYTVIVPSLPGCLTFGRTVEEASEMAKEAIEGFIACIIERGEEVPVETMIQ